MIVESEGKRRRVPGWTVYKRHGVPATDPRAFTLTYLRRARPLAGEWAIPVEHGGKLALTFSRDGMVTADGTPIGYYVVSWRQLPQAWRDQALHAIQYVQAHGDPIDNDESVF